jgi:uroporphyrinogen-III decarboxylase
MGIDFTIIPGKGPKIHRPLSGREDILSLTGLVDVERQVPFVGPILKVL